MQSDVSEERERTFALLTMKRKRKAPENFTSGDAKYVFQNQSSCCSSSTFKSKEMATNSQGGSVFGQDKIQISQLPESAQATVEKAAVEETVAEVLGTKRKAAGVATERPKRGRKADPGPVEVEASQGTADHVPLVTRKTTRSRRGGKIPVPASQSFIDAYIASKSVSQLAASDPSQGEASVHVRESLSPMKEAGGSKVGGQDDTKTADSEETDDDLFIMNTPKATPEKTPTEALKEIAPTLHAEQSIEAPADNTLAPINAADPPTLPSAAKSQHSSSTPNASKLKTRQTKDKAESQSAAKPSSSTQTLAAELNINLPMGFDYDLDFGFGDDEGEDQTLREIFPEMPKVDTPEIAQAKEVIKRALHSSTLPAMGDEMDAFQGALKCLRNSFAPDSQEASKLSIFIAETPKLAAQMNDAAKVLKISSSLLADIQARETVFNDKKKYLLETSAKNKVGQAKIEKLNKTLEDLKAQVERVEAELKSYDHIAASKAECDAIYLELHQLNKELKQKQTLKPKAEERKAEAETMTTTILGHWEALVKDNSINL